MRTPEWNPSCLQAWRISQGKTQRDLAEVMDVTETHISNVENGHRQYTQELLEKAAPFFGADPMEIVAFDPRDENGLFPAWRALKALPPHKLPAARKILEALAEDDGNGAPGENQAHPEPKRLTRVSK